MVSVGIVNSPPVGTLTRNQLSLDTQPPKITPAELSNLTESLQLAIYYGDKVQAKQVAEHLAHYRTGLKIELNPEISAVNQHEQDIKVKVFVEDRWTTGGCIPLRVKPSMTISHLKNKMWFDYGFPKEVQRWIVCKRIAQDKDTLLKCGVKAIGDTMFLYLISAESAGLQKDMFQEQELYSSAWNDTMTPDRVGHAEPQAMFAPISLAQHQRLPHSISSSPQPGSIAAVGGTRPIIRTQTSPPDTSGDPTDDSPPRTLGAVGGGEQIQEQRPVLQPESGQATTPEAEMVGWICPKCTFQNVPTRPGCDMCCFDRPQDYIVPQNYTVPESERARLQREAELDQLATETENRRQHQALMDRDANFQHLMLTDDVDLVTNVSPFECPICFDEIEADDGVILRDCLHAFCRDCLAGHVEYSEEPAIKCPFTDNDYSCPAVLQEREIKAIVSPEVYQRHLRRSLMTAESQAADSYHCKSPDCQGWCIYDDNDNFFNCPVCHHINCLTCKAIHEGMNCRQYQDDLTFRAVIDVAARQSQEMLQRMVSAGDALHCPTCNIILQKKEGCDWVQCTMCKTEICWVTKGLRWGPLGAGDITGGCMCRVNGVKCHPDCSNCH